MQSSAGSRRRARGHVSPRRLQPPGEARLSSLRRRRIAFLALAAALLAPTPSGAALVPPAPPPRDPRADGLAPLPDRPRRRLGVGPAAPAAAARGPAIRLEGLPEHALHAQPRPEPVAGRRRRSPRDDRRARPGDE